MLCNVALNGLEATVRGGLTSSKSALKQLKAHVVRYADDFVITGSTESLLRERITPLVEEFLKPRGLELHPVKTRYAPLTTGFDFLGFNLKRYPINYRLNQVPVGGPRQPTVLVLKAKKANVDRLKEKIKEIVKPGSPIESIIRDINPVLRG